VGELLRTDGGYGTIIASKEHIHVNGMNIRAWLDDFGSVILTKVFGEDLQIDDLCNSIETSHRSKRVLRIIENRGILKKIGETPMNVHDVVLYAPVRN